VSLVELSVTAHDDTLIFRALSVFCLVVGGAASLIYMIIIDEKTLTARALDYEKANESRLMDDSGNGNKEDKHPRDWL
jgi:hypothetical protein